MKMVEKQIPGIGVDFRGNAVIDPTKNVEDLVRALEAKLAEFRKGDERYIDGQIDWLEKLSAFTRAADSGLQTFAREAGEKLEAALRQAETNRINELAATRKEYENTIREMLAKSVESTSSLVSTQLVQIQATFDKRVSNLEAYQFTQAGRSSVADPALASALAEMAASIQGLTKSETKMDTRHEGANSMGSLVVGAAFVISTIVSIFALVLTLMHH
jgi:hypothetical protein